MYNCSSAGSIVSSLQFCDASIVCHITASIQVHFSFLYSYTYILYQDVLDSNEGPRTSKNAIGVRTTSTGATTSIPPACSVVAFWAARGLKVKSVHLISPRFMPYLHLHRASGSGLRQLAGFHRVCKPPWTQASHMWHVKHRTTGRSLRPVASSQICLANKNITIITRV